MHRIITLLITIALGATVITSAKGYDVPVGDFSELRVTDGINVDYACSTDSAGHVTFDCEPSMVSAIMLTNKNGRLTIQLSADELNGTRKYAGLPTIKVYSRFLTKAQNTADSTLRVLTVQSTPKFEAMQEGNGRLVVRDVKANEVKLTLRMGHGMLVVAGECQSAKIKFAGTGVIEADRLKATDVSINCSGTGSIGVSAADNLSVFGAGSTQIYYLGRPAIKNRSLGIKLIQLAN